MIGLIATHDSGLIATHIFTCKAFALIFAQLHFVRLSLVLVKFLLLVCMVPRKLHFLLLFRDSRNLGTRIPPIIVISGRILNRSKTYRKMAVMKTLQGRVVIRPITFRSDWSYFMNF